MTATSVESLREILSDDVEISVDPDEPESGVIIPVFKRESDTEYRFMIIPNDTDL